VQAVLSPLDGCLCTQGGVARRRCSWPSLVAMVGFIVATFISEGTLASTHLINMAILVCVSLSWRGHLRRLHGSGALETQGNDPNEMRLIRAQARQE
jgi:hypothetical protein